MRLVLTGIFVVLVAVRIPAILQVGRFWAEEGAIYFAAAWNQPWPDALLVVHTGYLNLATSVASLLALHVVPLEQAPRVTAIFALLVQTVPAALLATSRIAWLERWPSLAVALILLLVPGGDAEIWMNSITSQFHLALSVGLILAMGIRRGLVGTMRGAVLVAAPFAGPLASSLAPLFLIRAILERSGARLLQTVLLGIPALVQAAVVLTHPEPARAFGLGLPLLLAVIGVQNAILPLAGSGLTRSVASAAVQSFQNGGVPLMPILAAVLAFGALGFGVFRWGDRAMKWFFAAGCVFAVISYCAALTLGDPLTLLVWVGNRYSFAPTVLFSLSLLGLAATGPLLRRALPAALIGWIVCLGGASYFRVDGLYATGPDWRGEVAAWRRDPAHEIALWPAGWPLKLRLDPQVRPNR